LRQVLGPLAVAVDLLDQAVERPNLVPAAKKLPGDRTPDEAGAACY
jgi:hypothetical protein